jgi:hypothetical protein
MKFILPLFVVFSFAAKASPNMTVKERLRLHLWSYGMEDQAIKKSHKVKVLPEEIERALKKF